MFRQLMSISNDYITAMVSEEDDEEKKEKTSKVKHLRTLLFYPYIILLGLRFLLSSIALNFDEPRFFFPFLFSRHYFSLDPLCDLLLGMGIIDRYLALVIFPGPLFMLFLDYLVSYSRRFRIYFLGYDLLVLNRQDFARLNPQINWRCILHLLLHWKQDILEKVKFKWPKLPHFRTFSQPNSSIRFRAVILTTAFDLFLAFVVIEMAASFPLAFYFSLVTSVWNEENYFSAGKKAAIVVEGSLVLYTLWSSIKICLFFALSIINLIFWVLIAQQKVFNRELESLLVLNSKVSKERSAQALLKLSAYLPRYLSRHFAYLTDLLTINRQIISPTLLLIIATMMPYNVYGLTVAMLSRSLQLLQRLLILFIVLVQFTGSVVSLWPLISAHEAVYSPVLQLIRRSIIILSRNEGTNRNTLEHPLHLKWKLSTYYEVLTTGEKFSFTAGPVGKVTSGALFEVSRL